MEFLKTPFKLTLLWLAVAFISAPIKSIAEADSTRYPYYWLNPELNYLQFHQRSALEPFFDKWNANKPLTIIHFGDSHVQPDIFTSEVRKMLQTDKGDGGRGMIFPYAIAHTYSTLDYASYYTGNWRSSKSIEYIPKLPLGVTGVTAKTSDPSAGFTIRFHNSPPAHYRKLKLFVRQASNSFDLVVTSGGKSTPVVVDDIGSAFPYIEIELPVIGTHIQVQVKKSSEQENDFEFHGMSLESVANTGVLVHTVGIGGSQFRSLLAEKLFDEDVSAINPDLAILDFGTNDHLYNNSIPPDMESVMVKVIARVRAAAPNCAILLTSTQDMNRRGINITSGRDYSALVRKVAKEQNCAYYDWYWVSGGPAKMTLWERSGLAQADNIHLTLKGYGLKGKMLGSAFRSSLAKLEANADSLVFQPDTLLFNTMLARQDSVMKFRKNVVAVVEPPSVERPVNVVYHKISKGETLGHIAEKYHVSVASLKYANGLRSSKIVAGKTLRIEQPKAVVVAVSNKPAKVKQTADNKKIDQVFGQIANSKLIHHKIEAGETLSSIAEKYKVSVRDLKRINGLKTSRIVAGKTLLVEIPAGPKA